MEATFKNLFTICDPSGATVPLRGLIEKNLKQIVEVSQVTSDFYWWRNGFSSPTFRPFCIYLPSIFPCWWIVTNCFRCLCFLPAIHCTKNLIYIFLEIKLCCLNPSSYIHVSVSDFYIPTISLIWLQQNRQTDPGNMTINLSQKHECWKWERDHAVSFLGIFVPNFG